jgi:AmmeMemoRadiSam system protein A
MKTMGDSALPYGLTPNDVDLLFDIARTALHKTIVEGEHRWQPDLKQLPEPLRQLAATFVTLYTDGKLHGCIGSVEPRLPMAWDVAKNAIAAARHDPRFPVLQPEELNRTAVEISILTPLKETPYDTVDDLLKKIHHGVDGVMVERGWQRGLLLPQVWEQIPDPQEFLGHVALKAGATPDIYQDPTTKVYIFQVHSFTQPAPNEPS